MLVDAGLMVRALRLSPETRVQSEPLPGGRAERVILEPPGEPQRVVTVRLPASAEAATNHVAVMESLARTGFTGAPRLLGIAGDAAIEEWLPAASALAIQPPPGSCEAAIDVLATLHCLPIVEGLAWERSSADLIPGGELPLHRLGFASHERDRALEPLVAAHDALIFGPFGFAHRASTAANVLLAPGCAWLVDFSRAGQGAQFFDVAAFLLTAGLEPPERRRLEERYARCRSLPPAETADLIDLASILWAIQELLELPRRLIESLGDDTAAEWLRVAASRIDHGLRTGAGNHPAAVAIRAALWPS